MPSRATNERLWGLGAMLVLPAVGAIAGTAVAAEKLDRYGRLLEYLVRAVAELARAQGIDIGPPPIN